MGNSNEPRICLGWTRQRDGSGHGHLIYGPADKHVLVSAEPGSGKSRGSAIPNLLAYPGSVVVSDFKHGELTVATALWRTAFLGQPAYVFDPFSVVPDWIFEDRKADGIRRPERAQINPVQFVRSAKSPLTAALMVMDALIPVGGLKETHWADGAKLRGTATLLYVALDPRMEKFAIARDMDTFWEFMSKPDLEQQSLMCMLESDIPMVADQAQIFYKVAKGNTELSGIRNHIRVNLTGTLAEPAIMATLLDDSVDFTRLKVEPASIYIVLPGDMATTHFRYMRLIVSLILSYVERSGLYVQP